MIGPSSDEFRCSFGYMNGTLNFISYVFLVYWHHPTELHLFKGKFSRAVPSPIYNCFSSCFRSIAGTVLSDFICFKRGKYKPSIKLNFKFHFTDF